MRTVVFFKSWMLIGAIKHLCCKVLKSNKAWTCLYSGLWLSPCDVFDMTVVLRARLFLIKLWSLHVAALGWSLRVSTPRRNWTLRSLQHVDLSYYE
jgi:hypothetical protein